jgi:cell division protein FtsB
LDDIQRLRAMIKNALMLFFICAAVLIFFMPSYLRMQALNEKNLEYGRKIAELERDNTLSQEERRRLSDDPDYLEKVAREKLGIIREDEVIYKVLPQGQKRAGQEPSETAGLMRDPLNGILDGGDLYTEDLLDSEMTIAGAEKKPAVVGTKKKTVQTNSTVSKTSSKKKPVTK